MHRPAQQTKRLMKVMMTPNWVYQGWGVGMPWLGEKVEGVGFEARVEVDWV